MPHEITIPEVGESVYEVQIGRWLKEDGQWVEKDEEVVEIDTDKASMELYAPAAGYLKRLKDTGQAAGVGDVIARVEESAGQPAEKEATAETPAEEAPPREPKKEKKEKKPKKAAKKKKPSAGEAAVAETAPEEEPAAGAGKRDGAVPSRPSQEAAAEAAQPAAREAAGAAAQRVGREEVLRHIRPAREPAEERVAADGEDRREEVVPMSIVRRRIAARLVEVQQTAALLTTFNEVDMSEVQALRRRFGEEFQQQYGVKLGLMSFFVKAAVEGLRKFPALNATIRDEQIVYRNFYDIGIAVAGPQGLVVPVLRDAHRMSFAEIERGIADFVQRVQDHKLRPQDLEGGTFTITNGGVFGSMLSTPIVNPPQSGILGMHAIQDRPVAREGQVVVRPMMYLALTYDHRLIDGREAVLFLRTVRDVVEAPARLFLEM